MRISIESQDCTFEPEIDKLKSTNESYLKINRVLIAKKSSFSLEDIYSTSFILGAINNVGCGILAAFLYDLVKNKKAKIKIDRELLEIKSKDELETMLKESIQDEQDFT